MRRGILILTLSATVCAQAQLALDQLGAQFNVEDIRWEAGTNSVPASLAVYRVHATRFSALVISNVVALARFSDKPTALRQLLPALGGSDAFFREKGKFLSCSPQRGRIYYRCETAIALPKEPAEGVPSDEQVLDRAMELFPKLGVSEAWFGHAVGSNRLSTIRDSRTQTSFDKTAEKRVTRTIARGVFLPRATNGIAFAGRGTYDGLYVNIGSRGEIAELEFVCRNLQVHRVQPTALPQELIARIRSGKAVAQPDNVPTTSARLLIRKATPYYFAADALELQQFIVPFVSLQTHVEAATTNAEVVINCPVLK